MSTGALAPWVKHAMYEVDHSNLLGFEIKLPEALESKGFKFEETVIQRL
jgi:hypothetical protein